VQTKEKVTGDLQVGRVEYDIELWCLYWRVGTVQFDQPMLSPVRCVLDTCAPGIAVAISQRDSLDIRHHNNSNTIGPLACSFAFPDDSTLGTYGVKTKLESTDSLLKRSLQNDCSWPLRLEHTPHTEASPNDTR
jgi:hypothetical protein